MDENYHEKLVNDILQFELFDDTSEVTSVILARLALLNPSQLARLFLYSRLINCFD